MIHCTNQKALIIDWSIFKHIIIHSFKYMYKLKLIFRNSEIFNIYNIL